MRSALFCALAVQTASAQQSWTYLQPATAEHATVNDAVPIANGWLLVANDYVPPSTSQAGRVITLNTLGVPQAQRSLLSASTFAYTSFIVSDPATGTQLVGGFQTLVGTPTRSGYHLFRFDNTGQFLDSALYQFPEFDLAHVYNAWFDSEQDILWWAASGRTPGAPALDNRSVLLQTSLAGDSLNSAIYGNGGAIAIHRQIRPWRGNVWTSLEGYSPFVSGGWAQFLGFDDELQFVEGFAGGTLNGNSLLVPDSALSGVLDMIPIDNDRLLSAGHYMNLAPDGYQTAVAIFDVNGAPQRTFLPQSSYYQDYPAIMSTVSDAGNGTLWFAMLENAQLGPPNLFSPFEPDRIHIYKLDTALNVLCDHLVDGFAENAYYYLNRIKATDDGGFLLLGGRRDFSEPAGKFHAWAQKFGAEDCVVGVHENAPLQAGVVYPNPGREGFTLLLTGAVLNGNVLLFDSHGAACQSGILRRSQAHLDTQDLATGLYLYRAMDEHGRILAQGRWLKE